MPKKKSRHHFPESLISLYTNSVSWPATQKRPFLVYIITKSLKNSLLFIQNPLTVQIGTKKSLFKTPFHRRWI